MIFFVEVFIQDFVQSISCILIKILCLVFLFSGTTSAIHAEIAMSLVSMIYWSFVITPNIIHFFRLIYFWSRKGVFFILRINFNEIKPTLVETRFVFYQQQSWKMENVKKQTGRLYREIRNFSSLSYGERYQIISRDLTQLKTLLPEQVS